MAGTPTLPAPSTQAGARVLTTAPTIAPAPSGAPAEAALRRLDGALRELEAALARRLDAERRRSDLEIELEVMQDDRARLATELDGTTARLVRAEAANDHAGRRLADAIATVEAVLAEDAGAA
jgi:hypothetical protein